MKTTRGQLRPRDRRAWTPTSVSAEVEYDHRINVDSGESSTARGAILMYYDF